MTKPDEMYWNQQVNTGRNLTYWGSWDTVFMATPIFCSQCIYLLFTCSTEDVITGAKVLSVHGERLSWYISSETTVIRTNIRCRIISVGISFLQTLSSMTLWSLTSCSDVTTDQTLHQCYGLDTYEGFHGAFATGVTCQQGTLTTLDCGLFVDTIFLELAVSFPTFYSEYPSVLSRFCF